EDGPTHEPVEHLAGLRAMPNLNVFRPADARETQAAWYLAVTSEKTPTALVLKAAVRLSALQGLPVTYVFTHDSIAVGEDGPTHEPVEHLAGLRAMPNLNVFRPADARET
ncbi:hypothetical protein, partial [Haemophilus influenzae]|uniref:hypothetical protein n=1 Tax=Haemophilus influenzae TaxID=727 RepID=UPI0018E3CD27